MPSFVDVTPTNPEQKPPKPVDYANYKPPEERDKCCTKEVNPECFMECDAAEEFAKNIDEFPYNEETFQQVYNCVHCNACETGNSRYALKRKLHQEGFQSDDTLGMVRCFQQYGYPFANKKYRVKVPAGVPKESDTLLFIGCLGGIKVPEFAQHAMEYLLSKGVDFTILEHETCSGIPLLDSGEEEVLAGCVQTNTEIFNSGKYAKIICLCPACYDVFHNREVYPEIIPEVVFISDYLEPLSSKRSESVSVQHLCQMEYRGRADISKQVDQVLQESGFTLMENEKLWCCGGGSGIMHIKKTIDTIARIRVHDFHGDILTTYCVSCYQILKKYAKQEQIASQLVDTFKLLTE
jgi:Fe-S oxidoreductase